MDRLSSRPAGSKYLPADPGSRGAWSGCPALLGPVLRLRHQWVVSLRNSSVSLSVVKVFYVRMENERHDFNGIDKTGRCPVNQVGVDWINLIVFYRRHVAEFVPEPFDGREFFIVHHRRENDDVRRGPDDS